MQNFEPIPAINNTITDFKSMLSEEKDAFTLAETLITLMVIGVVAALTVPSLMQAYRDSQFATAKKKAMATVGNAYKKMMVEEETPYSDMPIFKCGTDFSCLSEVHRKLFNIAKESSKSNVGLSEKYTKSDADEEAGFKWEDVPYIFTTADGMTYGFLADEDNKILQVAVDLNGSKAPNKICSDVYKFSINNQGTVAESVEKVNGDTERLCEDLNNKASKCTAEDITKCETDAELALLYSSLNVSSDYGIRYQVISENSCLTMNEKSETCDYDYEYQVAGSQEIGTHYCYKYVSPGEDSYYMYYENYCR